MIICVIFVRVMIHWVNFIEDGKICNPLNYFHSRSVEFEPDDQSEKILQRILNNQEWYSSQLNRRPERRLAIANIHVESKFADARQLSDRMPQITCRFVDVTTLQAYSISTQNSGSNLVSSEM